MITRISNTIYVLGTPEYGDHDYIVSGDRPAKMDYIVSGDRPAKMDYIVSGDRPAKMVTNDYIENGQDKDERIWNLEEYSWK